MIPPQFFQSYAQYHEDIVLGALFDRKKDGFYVDVGANHEEYHSVTKFFYERGWHGINIEPIPRLIKPFNSKRPRDINLNYAVSSKKGTLRFREYPKHDGYSTFSEKSKKEHAKQNLPYKDYDVKVDSLENIFAEHKVSQIDFLKVDVEGFEEEVLKSNDWKMYRPTIVCIEANHRDADWSKYLQANGYERLIFDGLNEYYVAKESRKIFDNFAEVAATLAHNSIRSHQMQQWREDSAKLTELEHRLADYDTRLRETTAGLHDLQTRIKSIKFLARQLAKQLAFRLGLKK